jgi:hypothetical protein
VGQNSEGVEPSGLEVFRSVVTKLNGYYGYLLDTTTPYMLWSDECRIRCRSHLYGLLCQPEKQLAS